MKKNILCLANSCKNGARCVAGIDLENKEWVRPVNPGGEAVRKSQIMYDNYKTVSPLDVVSIEFSKREPLYYQPENIIIDDNYTLEKVGKIKNFNQYICEENNICSYCIFFNNSTDKLEKKYLENYKYNVHSLSLIKPNNFKIYKKDRRNFGKKAQIRACFEFNGYNYNLSITDDSFKNQFYNGSFDYGYYRLSIEDLYLTISLGSLYPRDKCHYKLVAAVIINEDYDIYSI